MVNLRDLAFRLAALRVINDRVAEVYAETRADLTAALCDTGSTGTKAEADGVKVASLSLTEGKPTPKVTDEAELTGWCASTFPTEVETVTRVRAAFRSQLLDRLVDTPQGAVDSATGEVVPGVQFTDPTPFVSLRMTREGREYVTDRLQQGTLDLAQLTGQSGRDNPALDR